MGTYIGTLGRLIQLRRVRTQDVEYWDGRTFQRTLEGRMRAQAKGTRNRAWTLDLALATPADLANIQALQDGEFGRGPFVFVPPSAPTTNMLSPDVSTCGPTAPQHAAITVGGPMLLPDGTWTGRSLINSNTAIQMWVGPATIPVIPGMTVTGSAYVLGAGAQMTVQFMNAAGAAIATINGAASGEAGVPKRLTVTALVPALAVAARLVARSTVQAARPSLTWTDSLHDWGIGAACSKAVPFGFNSQLTKVLGKPNAANLSSLSFTVQEVG